MEFTGERYIPDSENVDQELGIEHLNRYYAVLPYVAGKRVLDAACGVGYGAKILAGQASHVTGVDIDEETIVYAKKHYQTENIEFLAEDIQKTPLKSALFDVAVSFETVEHLSRKKQTKFLRELKRVLKKDGVLIISTPDKQHYSDEYNYHNKFHEKEFQHDEFISFLQSRFKHVEVYYQFFEVCNLLTRNESHSFEFLRKKPADASNGKYLVAVCSDMPCAQLDFSSLQIFAGEYGRRTSRILQLQDEVEERNQWATNLNEEIDMLRERVKALQMELVEANKEHAASVDTVRQELTQRSAEVAEQTATVQNLNAEAEKAGEHIALLTSALEQSKMEYAASIAAIRQELAQRSAEVAEQTATVQNLNAEAEKTGEYIALLTSELEQLKTEYSASTAAIRQELAQRSAEVAEQTATVQNLNAEAEKAGEHIALLTSELEQLKTEYSASTAAIRQELAQRSAEVVERTATVQRQRAEAKKMYEHAVELQAALEQTTRREEETSETLAEARSCVEEAQAQIKADKLRIGSLETDQHQLHEKYAELGKIHRSVLQERDGLKAQVKSANLNAEENEAKVACQQQVIDQQVVQLEKMNLILQKVTRKSEQKMILASNIEAIHHLRRKYQDQLYAELFTFKGLKDALRIDKALKTIKVRKKEYDRLFDRLPRRFVEYFDGGQYLQANQDVAEAIANGDFENALEHFVFFGYVEIARGGRRLYEEGGYFDEAKYLDANDDVRNALEKTEFRSAFEHYLMFGCFEIIAGDRKGSDADTPFRDRLHLFDPESVYLSQAMAITVPSFARPTVSIIIPAYNQAHYTFACIESIIANTRSTPYEIIVADDNSPDIDAQNIKHLVRNISFVENEENLGFLLNCNRAVEQARGKYLMFLNNDTNVQPGWLSALVELLESDKKIGMAGSKLVYPDGRLQEAGGIIWDDASGWNFGRLDDPEKPEYNYAKDVDYLSGAAMLVRKNLWEKLGGFDERYVPAYYEDTDLAFEIRRLGYRVVYQPQSVVVHFEGVSHGTDTASGVKQHQIENKEKFLKKWRAVLEEDHFKNAENVFLARDKSKDKKRLLYIDHYLPHYDQDAGSKATFLYLKALAKSGFQVYFIGDNFWHYPGLPYLKALTDLGVEVLWGDRYAQNWKSWLSENGQYLDIVVLSRPHISVKYIKEVKYKTDAKIIYMGHDLHFLREEREFEISKDENVLKSAHKWKEIELSLMKNADVSWFFSDVEKKVVADIDPQLNVQTVPLYVFEEFLEPEKNSKRTKDIVFVGGFGHKPNIDAVLWFVKEILPRILSALPDLKFYIVGSNPPDEIKSLSSDKIVVTGFVSDQKLTAYLNDCRLMVAPLRFGAGVKGKIVDAMYNGIPVVTTSVGAEGLVDSADAIVVADEADAFADNVINVYRNFSLCEKLSQNSNKYCREMFSVDRLKDIFHNL